MNFGQEQHRHIYQFWCGVDHIQLQFVWKIFQI